MQADAADVDACRRIIATADETFGTLHVLANIAALTERGSIWDTTPEFFDRMMAINVRAPFFLMQDAVKLMAREGVAGSIVNISSVASYGSEPYLCPYVTSKGALNALTKNVAYAIVRHRIRVNAINLGWMDSDGEDVNPASLSQRRQGLACPGRGENAVRPSAEARRGRAHDRLSGVGRVRYDDRCVPRPRPVRHRRRRRPRAAAH